MKIAVVSRRDSEQHREQYSELARSAQLTFFTNSAATHTPEWPRPGVRLLDATGGEPLDVEKLDEYAAANRIECIVLHGLRNSHHAEEALRVAKRRSVPWYLRIDTNGFARRPAQKFYDRTLVRATASSAAGALSIGSANEAYLHAIGIRPQAICRWPWKPGLDGFLAEPRKPLDTFRVLLAGRLESEKGYPLALRSISHIPASLRPEVRVAGSGSQLHELIQIARETNLDVTFLGSLSRSELATEMASASCLVVPSQREAWALVVNEALAAGCPVVAYSSVGSTRDLLASPVAGNTFDRREPRSLARAIEAVLTDPRHTDSAAYEERREIVRSWQALGSAGEVLRFLGQA